MKFRTVSAFAIVFILIFLFEACDNYNSQTNFSIEDSAKITRIEIFGKNDTTLLNRNDNKWTVNNKYTALPEAVKYIFRLSLNINLKSPVSKEENDSVLKLIKANAKEVRFYEEENVVKSWFIGLYQENNEGTYASCDVNDKAFLINVPGITNDINKNIPSENFLWITSKIFEYTPNQISEITVEYPEKEENSFILDFKDNTPIVTSKNFVLKESEIDLKSVGAYLSYFISVEFNSFIHDFTKQQKDSLLKQKPFAVIKVKDNSDAENTLKAYYFDNKSGNMNSYIGVLNNSEFVKVDFFETDLLMKEPDYFKLKISKN